MFRQCFLLILLTSASCSYAQSAQPTEKLAAMVLPKTVTVTVKASDGTVLSSGSGFVVAKNRIATNLHVLSDALENEDAIVTVRFGDGRVKVVSGASDVDPQWDIALLVADTGKTKGMPLGGAAKIGQSVMAVGSPRGLSGTVSIGIISAIREYNGVQVLQVTTPISPGSSGGVLVDYKGNVLGITSMSLTNSQSLNFAYPASRISRLLKKSSYAVVGWGALSQQLNAKTTASKTDTEKLSVEAINKLSFDDAYRKGVSYLESKRYDEAETYLRRAVAADPQSADAHQSLSDCLYKLEKNGEAISELAAMTIIRGDYDSYHFLGVAYDDNDEYDKAIQAYKKALYLISETEPKTVKETFKKHYDEFRTRWCLGSAYRVNKDNTSAIEHYFAACKLVDALLEILPEYSLKEGKEEDKLKAVMAEVSSTTYSEFASLGLIEVAAKHNGINLDDIIKTCAKGVTLNSDNYSLRLLYGVALYQNGLKPDALAQWKLVSKCSDKTLADKALGLLADYSTKE